MDKFKTLVVDNNNAMQYLNEYHSFLNIGNMVTPQALKTCIDGLANISNTMIKEKIQLQEMEPFIEDLSEKIHIYECRYGTDPRYNSGQSHTDRIDVLEEMLQQRDHIIKSKDADLDALEQAVFELRSRLNDALTAIENLNKTLHNQNRHVKEFEKAYSALECRNKVLETNIKQYESEILYTRRNNEQITQQLEVMQQKTEKLDKKSLVICKKAMDESHERMFELQEKYASTRRECDHLMAERSGLVNELTEHRAKLSDICERSSQLELEIKTHENAVKCLTQEANEKNILIDELFYKLKAYESAIVSADQSKSTLHALDEEYQRLREQYSLVLNERNSLIDSIAQHENLIMNMRAHEARLQLEYDKNIKMIEYQSQEEANKNQQINELFDKLNAYETALVDTTNQRNGFAELDQEYSQLRAEYERVLNENTSLQSTIGDIHENVQAVEQRYSADASKARRQIDELSEKLQAYELAVVTANQSKDDYDKLDQAYYELRQEYERKLVIFHTASAKKDEHENNMKMLDGRYNTLQNSYDQLYVENTDLKQILTTTESSIRTVAVYGENNNLDNPEVMYATQSYGILQQLIVGFKKGLQKAIGPYVGRLDVLEQQMAQMEDMQNSNLEKIRKMENEQLHLTKLPGILSASYDEKIRLLEVVEELKEKNHEPGYMANVMSIADSNGNDIHKPRIESRYGAHISSEAHMSDLEGQCKMAQIGEKNALDALHSYQMNVEHFIAELSSSVSETYSHDSDALLQFKMLNNTETIDPNETVSDLKNNFFEALCSIFELDPTITTTRRVILLLQITLSNFTLSDVHEYLLGKRTIIFPAQKQLPFSLAQLQAEVKYTACKYRPINNVKLLVNADLNNNHYRYPMGLRTGDFFGFYRRKKSILIYNEESVKMLNKPK